MKPCECATDEVDRCTVLDPFAGTGTTGLVAHGLGRQAILIEISPDYAQVAFERIGIGAVYWQPMRGNPCEADHIVETNNEEML